MLTKGNCFHLSTYNLTISRFPNLKASQIGRNFSTLWWMHSKTSLIWNVKYAFNECQKVWMSKSDHNGVGSYSQGFNLHTKFGTNGDKMKILDYWSLIERLIIHNLQTLFEWWCKRLRKMILNKLTSH
jgi:hypothetical protein